jgi:inner membrane protein
MDNLTHSLVGLTSAKAGLERLSPWATTVCVISANAADADFVTLFFGDRWTLLQHHRGITHSIVGTIAIGVLIPVLAYLIELGIAAIRKRPRQIRFSGLLLASLITAATHPLLDWTNNYGMRPFLPWSGRWFYGDLVYIVDPYIWLVLGVIAFLLTSNTRAKIVGWSVIGLCAMAVIGFAARPQSPDSSSLRVALAIWIVALAAVSAVRAYGWQRWVGRKTALAGLAALVLYWGILGSVHRAALSNATSFAAHVAEDRGERLLRAIAMPTAASLFRWQAVAETSEAMYRFTVGIGGVNSPDPGREVARFPKPKGEQLALVNNSEQDRRTQTLLGFARFPIARVDADNCAGQALVHWADLRYTEPGRGRGNFSVDVPVDCPSR